MRPSNKAHFNFPQFHQQKIPTQAPNQSDRLIVYQSMRLFTAVSLPSPVTLGSAVVAVSLPHRCNYRRGSAGTGSISIRCKGGGGGELEVRTCKNCKSQFDPATNHPSACKFHTAHFGGETKRKFESVYSGGTMNTPNSGKVYQYWHCCGSEDPFDPGCTSAPHASYDD